jgi:hypothetical protein
MNKTGAYFDMEREYITAPVEIEDDFSLTKIAKRYGRAPSSVARMSRLHDWPAKRAAYRGTVSDIVTDLDADTYARRLHGIHEKFVDAAETTLDQYIAAVKSGEYKPTANDVAKMVSLVREIVNKPQGGSEDPSGRQLPPGLNLSPDLARDFLGRLEGLARERLESGAGPGDPVVVSAPEGEGGRLRVR